ncbi:MAG: hypothetical protein MUF87_09980 [Anaerolineae bacterium]|jgi:tetratricopeptide (TPR) repeat protein|nr:hypothetical protein [Anaerolineae bacterium]
MIASLIAWIVLLTPITVWTTDPELFAYWRDWAADQQITLIRVDTPEEAMLHLWSGGWLNQPLIRVNETHSIAFSPILRANDGQGNADLASVIRYAAGQCDRVMLPFYQGVCALQRGDLNAAEMAFTPLNTPAARINLAWIYLQTGRAELGFLELDRLIAAAPEHIPYYVTRAQLYALNFEFDAAIGDLDTAIGLAQRQSLDAVSLAHLYVQRGQIRLLLYEWDRVLADYDHAIGIAPHDALAYYYRGVLYYTTLVDRERALPDFERYLQLAPNGEHATNAAQYLADIKAELEALRIP